MADQALQRRVLTELTGVWSYTGTPTCAVSASTKWCKKRSLWSPRSPLASYSSVCHHPLALTLSRPHLPATGQDVLTTPDTLAMVALRQIECPVPAQA